MTAVYAVLGRPVGHSLSPELHRGWFDERGIDATYVALEVPEGRERDVPDAVRTLGLAGANLTAPLKEVVIPHLDAVAGDAALAGAVNVIARDGDRLVGENTDVQGFLIGLSLLGARVPDRVVVVGTGGAARAVALGLARQGAEEVRVMGRRPERAAAVVDALAGRFPRVRFAAGPVEAAPAGLVVVAASGRCEGVEALALRGRTWVDLSYREPDRLSAARHAGCVVHDGLAMLVGQAVLAFERWTGALPDPRVAFDRLRAARAGVPLARPRC